MSKTWRSCYACRRTVTLIWFYALAALFFTVSIFPQVFVQTSSTHIFLKTAAPHLQPGTTLCFMVKNSRYLLNGNGFQIGHWGSALTGILGELEKKLSLPKDKLERVYVLLTDSEVSRNKLRTIENYAVQSEYMSSTLNVLTVLTRKRFKFVRSGEEKNSLIESTCYQQNSLLVDANDFPTDDRWMGRLASKTIMVMKETFKCNQSATDDVLIYNRRGTREIRNHAEVASLFRRNGLSTTVLTPNDLSPMEQICELTKNRKMIITPHGGHQGTFLFKREGVAVVVVSPKSALLECYRFFAKRSDPWYSVRGERAWSCPDVCSDSEDAFFDPSCDRTCIRMARRENADVSLDALRRVLTMHFGEGTSNKISIL